MSGDSSNVVLIQATPVVEIIAELGESPLWDCEVGLRWVDVIGQQLLTLGLDGQQTAVALPKTITAVELGQGKDLLAVTSTGFALLDPDTGRLVQEVSLVNSERASVNAVSMNDAGIDACGRAWAGSAVRDQSRRGALYSLEGKRVTRHIERIGMSNGIDWSPPGDVMYHVDSAAGTVTAWEYDELSGELGASRVLRSVPAEVGLPDGLTVDAEGDVWLAIWGPGQVWRLDSHSGETTAVVEVRTPCTTSCAFGGPDLSTLYVTTANHGAPPGGGILYSAEVPVTGRNPHRFAGGL